MPALARPLATALSVLTLLLGGVVAAAPAQAVAPAPPDSSSLRDRLGEGGTVRPLATIEDEEGFCQWLTGVYVNHPTYYTVRLYNCRQTDIFVKAVFLNGTFGTCVLVPARHSRHLGGSVVKPIDDAQIC